MVIEQGTSREAAAEIVLEAILSALYSSALCLEEDAGHGYADAEIDNMAPGEAKRIVAGYFAGLTDIVYRHGIGDEGGFCFLSKASR